MTSQRGDGRCDLYREFPGIRLVSRQTADRGLYAWPSFAAMAALSAFLIPTAAFRAVASDPQIAPTVIQVVQSFVTTAAPTSAKVITVMAITMATATRSGALGLSWVVGTATGTAVGVRSVIRKSYMAAEALAGMGLFDPRAPG